MDTSLHPPGRPRSQRANDAILKAALELLAEQKNLADISMDAIAGRARVGKATIYRRWSCKSELLSAAVGTLRPPLPEVGHGAVRDDLAELVAQICSERDSPLDTAIHGLMLSDTHPEIIDRIKRNVFAPRETAITTVLRRGVAAGELRSDLEPEIVLWLLVGGARAGRGSTSAGSHRHYAEHLVDTVLDGLRPAGNA